MIFVLDIFFNEFNTNVYQTGTLTVNLSLLSIDTWLQRFYIRFIVSKLRQLYMTIYRVAQK